MNTVNIEKKIKRKFPNTKKVDKDILRCEHWNKNKVIAIYYFDYSQKILRKDFDITNYQIKLISTDYYAHEGYLQWNYYLYFVCDKRDLRKIDKSKVQENTEYARKCFLTPQELDNLLERESYILSMVQGEMKEDISITWIKELSKNDLDGVYLDNSYKDVVENYINSEPIKEAYNKTKQSKSEFHLKIPFLSKFLKKKFRAYPKGEKYEFKRVNLIEGANGTGKTSLLEAIELILCGKTHRNRNQKEKADMALYYNDGKSEDYDLENNRKFQQRDLSWYGNPYTRGNRLYQGFSRYNFYDADSAYKLVYEKESKEIEEAFLSLALGQNANYIDDRMGKILEKFKDYMRIYEKDYEGTESRLKEINRIASEITLDESTLLNYLKSFKTYVKKSKWLGYFPVKLDDNLSKFENEYSALLMGLDNLKSNLFWMSSISIAELAKENEVLGNMVKKVKDTNVEIKKLNMVVKYKKMRLDNNKTILKLLEEMMPYISEPGIEHMIGMNDLIKKLKVRKKRLEKTVNIKNKLEKNIELDYNKSLSNIELTIKKKINGLEDTIKSANDKIKGIRLTFTKIENIVNEIKIQGKGYLAMNPHAKECPLCKAKYEVAELSARINEEPKDIRKTKALEQLLNDKKKLSNELRTQKKTLENIAKLKEISFLMSNPINKYNVKVKEVYSKLDNIEEELKKVSSELRDIKLVKQKFDLNNLFEEEYIRIKEAINYHRPRLRIDFKNKRGITEERNKYSENCKTIEKDIKNTNATINDLKALRARIFEKYFIEDETKGNILKLRKRFEITVRAKKELDNICKKVKIGNNDDINGVKSELGILNSAFLNYKESIMERRTNVKLVKKYKKTIAELKSHLKVVEPKKERASNGKKILENIMSEYSKEKYWEEFLVDNKERIVRIFKEIHSPKEFIDIVFIETKKEIKEIHLTHEKKEKPIPLTQISSGQRAALSISIFLTLNCNTKTAPPIIMLDEPISYIDDLNILSFIDYLRDIVMYFNRQVFFTTASEKIAKHFKKKFEFLGDNFGIITLER